MDFVSQYERFIHENAFEIAKNVANFVPAPVCQNYPTQVNWTVGVPSPSYRLIVEYNAGVQRSLIILYCMDPNYDNGPLLYFTWRMYSRCMCILNICHALFQSLPHSRK